MFKKFEDIKVGDKFVCLTDAWDNFTKGKEYTIIVYKEDHNSKWNGFGVLGDCSDLNYIYSRDVDFIDFPNSEETKNKSTEFSRENFLEFIETQGTYREGFYTSDKESSEYTLGKFEAFLESRKSVDKEVEKAIELLKLKGYHVARSDSTKGE